MKKRILKKKIKPTNNIGINIGVSRDSIIEARATIIAIINTRAQELVLVEALKTLSTLCGTNNATISNCSVGMKD